jgi:hypothetical protein
LHKEKNNTQNYARASFNCNKEILDNFRKAVAQKYGRLWGVLHIEFEKALKERLERILLGDGMEAS